jgi:hypothetical protein
VHIPTDQVEGVKTWLKDDEDWEGRTWRQVIKLKEDMWRARVGLREGDD